MVAVVVLVTASIIPIRMVITLALPVRLHDNGRIMMMAMTMNCGMMMDPGTTIPWPHSNNAWRNTRNDTTTTTTATTTIALRRRIHTNNPFISPPWIWWRGSWTEARPNYFNVAPVVAIWTTTIGTIDRNDDDEDDHEDDPHKETTVVAAVDTDDVDTLPPRKRNNTRRRRTVKTKSPWSAKSVPS